MDRKQMVRLVLGFSALAVAMLALPSVAIFAQEAGKAAEHATFLTSQGAAWLGGAIGAGARDYGRRRPSAGSAGRRSSRWRGSPRR
jgi:hypothetical protein